MKKILFYFIFLILGVSLVNAVSLEDFDSFCEDFEEVDLSELKIPSFIPYKNEIFNFYIEKENINGSIILVEGEINSVNCKENDNPTYNLYIDSFDSINDFVDSEDVLGLYNEKIENGEIEIKGTSFGKNVKLFFTKIAIKFVSWFK